MKKSNTYKIVIPEEVEKKIRFICNKISKDEWSGTLFYKPEGSFEEGTLTIRCVDIFVMDIGTAAYTEFDMSPDVVSYMTDNPDLLDCQIGLIHSHNSMSTFFSGTDTATLKEEGIDRNHFVSLIVNNEGTYTAAITRKYKSKKTIKEQFSYPTFEDSNIIDTNSYEEETEEIQWFYLKIEFEKVHDSFYDELTSRLNELKESKKRKEAESKPHNNNWRFPQNGKVYQDSYTPTKTELFPERKITQSYVKQVGPANINKEAELPFDDKWTDDSIVDMIPYDQIEYNEDMVKSSVLQLITGSIIIPNTSKIDVVKWSQGMVPLYKKRFGKGMEGIKLFQTWAENHIEFICFYSQDDELINQGLSDEEISAILAYKIIEELEKLPRNEYITTYIDILTGYLI